jgi:hypothetical protein
MRVQDAAAVSADETHRRTGNVSRHNLASDDSCRSKPNRLVCHVEAARYDVTVKYQAVRDA